MRNRHCDFITVLHDGVCGSVESYACTDSLRLARILMRFALRFALLECFDDGGALWAAKIPRSCMQELSEQIERELPEVELAWSLIDSTTDMDWDEDMLDQMRNVSASRS